MPKRVKANGKTYVFPDEATDDQVQQSLMADNPQAKLQSTVATLRKNIDTPAGGKGYQSSTNPDDYQIGAIPKLNKDEGGPGILRQGWDAVKNLVKIPGDAAIATQPVTLDAQGKPQADVDALGIDAGLGMVPGASELANLTKHVVVDPMQSEAAKARQYEQVAQQHPELDKGFSGWVGGPTHLSRMHAIASGIPIIGPVASNLASRVLGGDPTGAVTKGLVYTHADDVVNTPAMKSIDMLQKGANKVAYPNAANMVKTPAAGTVNPVEAFTPLEIKEFAQQKNIPMTAAEITNNGPLRSLQSVGEKSLTGSGLIKEHKDVATGAVHKLTKQMAVESSPKAATAEIAGRMLRDQVQEAEKTSKANYDQAYADFRSKFQDPVDVDLSPLNKKYGNMKTAQQAILDNIPTEQATKINQILDKASDFGEHSADGTNPVLDLDAVKELRSHWLEAQRELVRRGRKDSREAALATNVSMDLDSAMETAIQHKLGDAGVAEWRNANQMFKEHQARFHGDDSVVARILGTGDTDLVKLGDQILEKGTGGNPAHIRQLREAGIDLSPLQRHAIDRIHNSGFNNARNTLGGYEDEFLQSLFADNPNKLNDLYKTARIGRSVKVDTNPSNTGGALSATQDVETIGAAAGAVATGNPAAAAGMLAYVPGMKRLAAGLTTSKWFNDWMTRVPKDAVSTLKRGGTGPTGGDSGGNGLTSPHGDPRPGVGKAQAPNPANRPPDGTGSESAMAAGDTSFDFGANSKKDIKPTDTAPGNNSTAVMKLQKSSPRTLSANNEGGANYSAADLAALKAKHGIKDVNSDLVGDVDRRKSQQSFDGEDRRFEEPDPWRILVKKNLDKQHDWLKNNDVMDSVEEVPEAVRKLEKKKK